MADKTDGNLSFPCHQRLKDPQEHFPPWTAWANQKKICKWDKWARHDGSDKSSPGKSERDKNNNKSDIIHVRRFRFENWVFHWFFIAMLFSALYCFRLTRVFITFLMGFWWVIQRHKSEILHRRHKRGWDLSSGCVPALVRDSHRSSRLALLPLLLGLLHHHPCFSSIKMKQCLSSWRTKPFYFTSFSPI